MQANAVCKETSAKIEQLASKHPGSQEIERLASANESFERAALAKLRKLRPPTSLEHDWKRLLGDRQTLVDELAELVSDAKRKNQDGIDALSLTKRLAHSTLEKDADELRINQCAAVG